MADAAPDLRDPREPVDMRGRTPRAIVDILDAVAHARNVDRFDIVNDVLLRYTRQLAREATVIMRVTGGNPPPLETGWKDLE